jgi:hypothetical protein
LNPPIEEVTADGHGDLEEEEMGSDEKLWRLVMWVLQPLKPARSKAISIFGGTQATIIRWHDFQSHF